MYCDRWGRPLRQIQKDELDTCRDECRNCFSCGCLHYDLADQDFEDPDSWPPDDPDHWPDEEYMQARLLESLLHRTHDAGLTPEVLDELNQAWKRMAEQIGAVVAELEEAFQQLANEIGGVMLSIARMAAALNEKMNEEAWENDDDRETIRPARTTEEPDPLLRSRSLWELYGQGFDPWPPSAADPLRR